MISNENRAKLKAFALIFLPLVLLICSISVGMTLMQKEAYFKEVARGQEDSVKFEKRLLESALISYMADASSLAGTTSVELQASGEDMTGSPLASIYSAFANSHQIYDQVRFLDSSGKERVRIDWDMKEKATVTPLGNLQNKANRPYFAKSKRDKPSIYLSRFDLNIENNVVQRPFKPMLRIVSPVFGANGTWAGVVVLNVKGKNILAQLSKADAASIANIYLTNSKGQWLKGHSPESEWLFMFEEDISTSMGRDFPGAWQNIAGFNSGQFQTEAGLFTFSTIDASSLALRYDVAEKDIIVEENWKIITLVPADKLIPGWWNKAIWSTILALVVSAVLSWIMGSLMAARSAVTQQLLQNERQLRSITQTVLDAIIMIDQRGNAVFWNTAAETLFGVTADEVLGNNIHDFIAPKKLREEAMTGFDNFSRTGQGPIVGNKREVEALRSDGTLFPAELNINALSVNGEWWAVGVVRDITHRKEVEHKLVQLNKDLEERVKTRTGELEEAIKVVDRRERLQKLLMDIANTSNTAESVNEAMRITLLLIAKYTGWPVGHIYLWSDDAELLIPSGIWQVSDNNKFKEFMNVTDRTTFEPGIGLPGRVYASRKPHWIDSVAEDDNYPRARGMKNINIRSAFGFPVFAGNYVPAVFEFYSETTSSPNYEILEMAEQVSLQLGHVVERKRIEKERVESEQLFRGIFEQSFQTIVILYPNGLSIKFNENALKMFGLTENEGQDSYIWDYPRWNKSEEITSRIQKAVTKASAGDLVRMNISLDENGDTELDFSLKPILAANGEVLFLIAEGRDITEIKKVEAEVRKLALVAERTLNGVIITDNSGLVEWVNEGFTRITGYTLEEMQGKSPGKILQGPETDPETVKRISVALRKGDGVNEEIINYGKNGRRYWIELDIQPIKNKHGKVEKYIAIQSDITERINTTQELSRFKFTLDHTHDAVFIFDPDTLKFTYANHGARIQIGYSQEEMLEMTPIDIKPEFDEPTFRETISPLTKGDQSSFSFETIHKHKNGKLIPVDISLQYISRKNEPSRFVAIVRDITEQKRITSELEQAKNKAETATRAKSDFLANMSHEIRTPMNAVIGMSHILLNSGITRNQQDQVNKILTASTALLGIINDILDFSKIEAGKMKLEESPFDLDDVLHELAAITHDKAEEKGLELIFDVNADVPRLLIGDPLRLGQVLSNLVGNAVKFTEKGSIVLKIESMAMQQESIALNFSVSDTGIGIAPEKQQELFEPFLQNDTSTTREYGGTGLGLSICMQLVKLMGGEIHIDSSLGKGSKFYFTLNFKCQSNKCHLRAPMNALSGARVLVVDESELYRSVYDNLFHYYEFVTTFADTWQQAESMLQENHENNPFDLLLLSLDQLGPKGFNIKDHINGDERYENLKVITITAFPRQLALENSDMVPDLVKPISQSSLFNAILLAFGKNTVYQESNTIAGMTVEYGLDVLKGKKILVAEDNELNQEVARELLEAVGGQVTIVENGVEAVKAVENNLFDAIVMDVQMPVMGGFEATRLIRESFSAENLPIIAMTAHAMAGDREKSLESGMNDHVTKPVEPKKLYLALIHCFLKEDASISLGQEYEERVESPHIHGINTKQGLARVAGNMSTYRRLLQQFKANQADAMDNIKEDLRKHRISEARQAVHALKGASGNLGAEDLFNSLVELETSLKDGLSQEIDSLVERSAEDLEQAMKAIESYFEEYSSQKETDEDGNTLTDEEIRQKLIQLEQMLTDNDADALPFIENMADHIRNNKIVPTIHNVVQAARIFDFDSALEFLQDLLLILDDEKE